jgi:hypothetical protein
MRISGKHILLAVVASVALAGCGGEEGTENGATNSAPIISGSPPTTLSAGSLYSFTPTAADPDGDTLTFSASNVPAWATFNASTGRLTGTPAEANVGMSQEIEIEVSDSKVITQLPAFRIQVTSNASAPPPANSAPTLTGTAAATATVGQSYTFSPVGDDADDDNLTYTIQNRPSWLVFTAATGRVSGTPTSANVGSTGNINITVSDGEATDTLTFAINVQAVAAPANRAPTITGTPNTTVTANTQYTFQPVGSDPDGNSLTYSIQNQPVWATFSTSTGRLRGTPASGNVGTSARITISVTDGTATTSLPSFTIQVNAPANRAPTIAGAPLLSTVVGLLYSFQPSASDPDGNALTFSIQNRPSWANFETSTGRLSGTPGLADILNFSSIVISVTDGTATVSLPSFNLSVIALANGSATVSWTPPTTNTDGSTLGNLSGYRILYGPSADNLNQSVSVNNAGASSIVVDNLATGTWFFGVIAVNAAGLESEVSQLATKIILL